MRHLRTLAAVLGGLLLPAAPAAQQLTDPAAPVAEWNGERALELIGRAQQRRAETNADTGLVNYQADARLFVYFYLDRPGAGERNLVKTDQLALDVLWQAPDQTKQRIVGWRNQKSLPTNINYHLDHLTVVQENFGDEILLGDGDEVRGVPHPAAPGATSFYQYRLADSLTLQLPGAPEPVRVYQLEVRPRDPSQPRFVGSVFVERRRGDIVRMDFTFTPASYVDRYLDYINISLDNGLWRGEFWLPNQQRVEIRRRIPQLDIPVGSVIRATMRVGNYRFNQNLPLGTFAGPPVVALPRSRREAFPFEEDLLAEVREEGIGPEVELGEIREQAAELVRQQLLQRASGVRLRVPRASELLRYNRAEGAVVSVGLAATPVPGFRAGVQAGWAFGAEHPVAELAARADAGGVEIGGALYANRARDVGIGPATSGAANTLAALVAGEDYLDPFFATGAEVSLQRALSPSLLLRAEARLERQRSAERETSFSLFGDHFRPVFAIDRTDRFVGGSLGVHRASPAQARRWWSGSLLADAGWLAGDEEPNLRAGYLKPQAEMAWGRRFGPAEAALEVRGRGGLALGDLPRQGLYLLGGRGTLPGYRFRAFGGDRFALGQATLSADLARPWLRGRLLAAAGWAGAGGPAQRALLRWPASPTDGVRASVGLGVGILHDILHVDVARGLGAEGGWELIVEANPSFWDFL